MSNASTVTSPPAATPSSAPPASAAPVPMPPADEVARLATGANALGVGLFKRVAKRDGKNSVISPASLSIALAMTYGGAKGETAAQMKKVLGATGDADATATSWGTVSRALTDPSRPLTLRLANRLFGEKTFAFQPTFLERTSASFGAPLEPVDFVGALDPSRRRINAWVEEQTQQRIKDLLPEGALEQRTRLVLVNAIYFLADWEEPFLKDSTRSEPFRLGGGRTKSVPMMHRTSTYPTAKIGGARVLRMPYQGGASMLIVLPDAETGLAALEASLDAEKFASWTKALSPERVHVSLPRYEVTTPAIGLKDDLSALGMPLAFDRAKADFTGIADPPRPEDRLSIDKVIHKAFVKVDEKGTEAAAATGVVMGTLGGMPAEPLAFKVDHPFLYAIVDDASGLLLFLGRVAEP